MSFSLTDASVTVVVHALKSLVDVLKKAQIFAVEHRIDDVVLLNTRLHPTMFPLIKQLHIATDVARRGLSRIIGAEAAVFTDDETTFAGLIERIEQNIALLNTFDSAVIDAAEDKVVQLSVGGHEMTFSGRNYVQLFIVPNVYFHLTTAYAILRQCGVPLGKADFLGKIQ